MSYIYNVNEKMHKMRAKLYPNYLPGAVEPYIARTAIEDSVSLEDICAAMKNRGGYDGSYEDAVQTVRHYHLEMLYQLCDGFSVNNGFFSIRPNIGGTFQSEKEAYNPEKHQITFRFHSLKAMRDVRSHIDVSIDGCADVQGYIGEFIDTDEKSVNTLYSPGDQFVISGVKIKIAGDEAVTGVFFVPVTNPGRAIQATRIADNTPTKIIGIAPRTEFANVRIEIRTQYAGSANTLLKTPRVITSGFVLEEV